jgi:phospholipid/cholesterol/gamma-HCH transport system permease protein
LPRPGGLNSLTCKELIYDLQEFYLLSTRGLLGVVRKPFYFKDTIEQMDYAGAGSFFIIVLISLFVGMALSLQLAAELSTLGLKITQARSSAYHHPGLISCRPCLFRRVGAGIASELGSMVLGHQVDTLRVFGVDPIKKLVTPRVITAIIMLPVLTIIGDAISLLGGYYISVFVSHQSGTFYWSAIRNELTFQNVFRAA